MSKAKNVDDIIVLQIQFGKLLTLLEEAKKSIIAAYRVFIPPAVFRTSARAFRRPAKKKTGIIADVLRRERPSQFPKNWPTLCQKIKQPTLIVGEQNVKKYLRAQ